MYQQGGNDFVRKAVETVFALYKEGKIKAVLDSTWALEDVSILTLTSQFFRLE